MNLRPLLPVLLCALVCSGPGVWAAGGAGAEDERGDSAAAERYLSWAEQELAAGRRAEALAGLERAADFADVSSDLSYLLALVRSHEGKSRWAVLEALNRALEAPRWVRYTPAQARLLQAEQLIALRQYSAALSALADVPAGADAAALGLAAFKGLAGNAAAPESPDPVSPRAEFRRRMGEALDRYPRDPRPLRIFFEYARNRNPAPEDQDLMELVLRRLPFLLETDPDLAWMAAPFVRDFESARRMVAACRAGGYGPGRGGNRGPHPASVPAALNLGLIGDEDAVEELLSPAAPVLDEALIIELGDLLRSEKGRNLFAEKLLVFTGIILSDEDRDGYPEGRARYRDGTLEEYRHDADQDGLDELVVSFDAGGVPRWAEQTLVSGPTGRGEIPALPRTEGELPRALILWERYPAVLRVELEGQIFTPRPGDFQFGPLRFTDLAGSGTYAGLGFPRRESRSAPLTFRTLVSFSLTVQRPSAEFPGAVEWIDLDRSIPRGAVEILQGRIVSSTEFEQGVPVLQRLDLDMDGRMETLRRFRRIKYREEDPLAYQKIIEFSESDWNGDGMYETGELYLEDGSVVYSWDMDGDGIREYSEVR
jgi:hypothetical protein